MEGLDDQTLKTEIEEISKRIDHIIKNVNQFHPVEVVEETAGNSDEQKLIDN